MTTANQQVIEVLQKWSRRGYVEAGATRPIAEDVAEAAAGTLVLRDDELELALDVLEGTPPTGGHLNARRIALANRIAAHLQGSRSESAEDA